MLRKRILFAVFISLLIAGLGVTPGAQASVQIPQTPLNPLSIPKYVTPVPVFGPAGSNARVPAGSALAITYNEFQQKVLPDSFYAGLPSTTTKSGPGWSFTFNPRLGTYVWGYKVGGASQLYPGFTVEAQRGTATTVTFTNELGTATEYPKLQRYLTADQTIMFANPLGLANGNPAKFEPYVGPQPVVPHLHGGELRSDSDGGPDEWWTPGGEGYLTTPMAAGGIRGPGYFKNIYTYPNTQEATTLWFHDHVLGETRCNVYAGLAAFWFVRDQYDTGTVGTGLNLPAGPQEIELVFQDRQFDTQGQWLWPDGYPAGLNGPPTNPDIHPFWNPEFFGPVIVVNGRSWPYLNVEPRRYRLRLLNGSNARFYEMRLWNRGEHGPAPGPPLYVIGTDGGLLDTPVITSNSDTNRLIIAPGERYDVIIDFSNFKDQTLTLENYAAWPFPGGDPVDPNTDGQIMQFVVSKDSVTDTSYNPATGDPIRGGNNQPPAIVRLVDADDGTPGAGVTINKKRQLVLREVEGPGGPIEVLLNNTKFDGLREGTAVPVTDSYKVYDRWMTEFPQVGATEEWELINTTGDAHPIHVHLIQFQVMNRQTYDDVTYTTDYEALFPGGTVIDGYGPPGNYNQPNADGAIGGNPAVSTYLNGAVELPLPQERGWKDTVIAYPGQVTRIIARWAPQDVALDGVRPPQNKFAFNATYGPGYVWHCHILDHEDNEMMRPYIPSKSSSNILSRYGGETGAVSLILMLNQM